MRSCLALARCECHQVAGTYPECELVLKVSDVSKRHCQVVIAEDTVTVEDLGSVNGTFVNGGQLEPGVGQILADGDQLDLAGHVDTVRLQPPSAG